MTNLDIINAQKAWIASGKIGCVFASALVKQADMIGWKFYNFGINDFCIDDNDNASIRSLVFEPTHDVKYVRDWALNHGFYIENIEDLYEGLRIKIGDNVSWVQYFGPDSHVKTRQSPYPMLMYSVKLPLKVYAKTITKGILHLAHASVEFLTAKKADTLWKQSFVKTKQIIGHSPTIREAAKTTFIK
jgi:hypothetical protein